MRNDVERVLYSKEELDMTVKRIAARINEDYSGESIVAVCILKGSIMFYADLVRQLEIDCVLDFMSASSYGKSAVSSGDVKIIKDINTDISGKNVVIIEDILDTGHTLSYIKAHLESLSPKTVKICALFDKPSRRVKDIVADYSGKTIDDLFIVGYGLDYNEKYRNLPYVGVLKKSVYE